MSILKIDLCIASVMPTNFIIELNKIYKILYGNFKRPRIARTILKKSIITRITLADFKISYIATINKIVRIDRDRIETPT